MPPELVPLAVARAMHVLPGDVRAMDEDDVLDSLAWMNVEGLVQERRLQEAKRAR